MNKHKLSALASMLGVAAMGGDGMPYFSKHATAKTCANRSKYVPGNNQGGLTEEDIAHNAEIDKKNAEKKAKIKARRMQK